MDKKIIPDGAYLAKYRYDSIKGFLKPIIDPMRVPYPQYIEMNVPETSYNCIAQLVSNQLNLFNYVPNAKYQKDYDNFDSLKTEKHDAR